MIRVRNAWVPPRGIFFFTGLFLISPNFLAATARAFIQGVIPMFDCQSSTCPLRAPQRESTTALRPAGTRWSIPPRGRSEEHTSELQSLMRISYAVFCLKKQHNSYTRMETTKKHQAPECKLQQSMY